MKINFNFAPDTKVTLKANGQTETVDLWSRAHKLLDGHAGRVNVYDHSLSSPSSGTAVARSDGKTTLDLSDRADAGDITASLHTDRKAVIRVGKRQQRRGHPSGEHYWLPVDANKRFVCEPGRRHRKWYLSRSSAALTRAQIAADAGVSEATVTGAWLLTRPQYGGTAATAIHFDLFSAIRSDLVGTGKPSRSDHWRLERGYDYVTGYNYSNYNWGGFCGEDELHPMLIGAFGTGADPVIKLVSNFLMLPFCVIQDVKTTRDNVQFWYSYSVAFDHADIGLAANPSNNQLVTFRETTFLAPWYDAPKQVSADNKWVANGNHLPGIYAAYTEGILVDSCLIDHAGWADGYDYNGSAAMPMPMSKYSHALYFAADTFDITIRNNLLSRSSSCGVQMRSGLHLEGNLLVDNNLGAAVNSTGGVGQFNNVIDNVIYSAGYKRVAYEEGALDWGFDVNGPLSSMGGNIIAHGKNPDDPAEAYKAVNWNDGVSTSAKMTDDTQVWKWGAASRNVGGLAPAILDKTTIWRRAGERLGKEWASIPEYVAHVAAAPSIGDIVREDIRWTKSRFGSPIPARTAPADLVFYPDPNFDGFRWDNRRNWSSKDLPGTHVADSADLDGHFVRFGTVNASVAALALGGGVLEMTSGRLDVGTITDAGTILTRLAGQIWIGGAAQPLSAEVVSGRLALTGAAADLDL
ncbi:hypothetical protein, partial [Paracoccus sp. 22332]|uniref:hypothetical protein n=1 Tax=Paracoccus sp. 22332 TaxID=3453913 RepID=UPI003F86A325